jgi:hypothetical protein
MADIQRSSESLMRRSSLALFLALMAALSGCDQLGIESATVTAARREAEGKAIGGGCRHAARSVETCYTQNKRADKAAVFAGWREMNDYMRENKIEAMPAAPEPVEAQAAPAEEGADTKVAKADKPPKEEKPEPPAPKRRRGPP